jgi:hypothetical protein
MVSVIRHFQIILFRQFRVTITAHLKATLPQLEATLHQLEVISHPLKAILLQSKEVKEVCNGTRLLFHGLVT